MAGAEKHFSALIFFRSFLYQDKKEQEENEPRPLDD